MAPTLAVTSPGTEATPGTTAGIPSLTGVHAVPVPGAIVVAATSARAIAVASEVEGSIAIAVATTMTPAEDIAATGAGTITL
jgi:hypothetical protein